MQKKPLKRASLTRKSRGYPITSCTRRHAAIDRVPKKPGDQQTSDHSTSTGTSSI